MGAQQQPLVLSLLLRIVLGWLLGGGLLLSAVSYAGQPISTHAVEVSELGDEPLSLTRHLAVLEDASLTLSLADVQAADIAGRFKYFPAEGAAMSFGFSHSAYWLRLRLHNSSEQPVERMLEVGSSLLSAVHGYLPQADGSYQVIRTGQAQPFATRAYKNRHFVFPIVLPAYSEYAYYLKIQSDDAIVVPVALWSPSAFHEYERNDYLAQAGYFGMAMAMVLFNLLLYIALRDVIHLWYVLFVASVLFALAALSGMAHEFLWPEAMRWSNSSVFVGFAISIAAILQFMRVMLETNMRMPRLDRLILLLVGIHLLLVIGLLAALPTFAIYAEVLNIATGLLLLTVIVHCAYRRQRSAYFFVAAFTTLLLAGFVVGLKDFGLLPSNILTENALQIGSAIEMLVLALALADRFNLIRQEKAEAQQGKLAAQEDLLEHLLNSERELEARVAQRTAELKLLNDKLEALSATDGLTGLANRRRFDEVLAIEWVRAERVGQSLALAVLDVDWFKTYNDHYGHQAGDECLRQVASVLVASICRTGDFVARYGGEEFVFIAPATDGASALKMARKVCEALQAKGLPHESSIFGCVTVSIGVAAVVPSEKFSAEDLLREADHALYQAKNNGRNQSVLARTNAE
ncbi:diguanylate cyclase [Ferriphaselus sp. R-1]|uniref:diguanylate cyclase n=1 Tax=Ferriphaselus sp. R-1 TaxID=1485544 RepID=UPI000AE74002|nr:diguanylate cyclase [Ferriphaselus sp. R-1]